jgi:D-xylose 1-dehydrogenase (NADP+, D-xylono-1,5-lactone-forming)
VRKIRWGILSTAAIGRIVAEAVRAAERAAFVSVASRNADRARSFADELGIPDSFGSYEQLLARDDVDAVYVPLPVSMHTEWTIAALQAGKHVLCEKPFAVSAADAAACFDAADAAGRMCFEAFMCRFHPQTLLARRLVADGAIGQVAIIRAALSVAVPPGDIRRSAALAGGALLDLGAYCVSGTRLYGGIAERVYAEQVPDTATDASGRPVDLRLAGTIRMTGNVLGHFDAGLDLPRRDQLDIVGTDGVISLADPWLCRPGYVDLVDGAGARRLPVDPDGRYGLMGQDSDAYRIEFDTVSRTIAGEQNADLGRTDAVRQAATLAAVRESWESGTVVRV